MCSAKHHAGRGESDILVHVALAIATEVEAPRYLAGANRVPAVKTRHATRGDKRLLRELFQNYIYKHRLRIGPVERLAHDIRPLQEPDRILGGHLLVMDLVFNVGRDFLQDFKQRLRLREPNLGHLVLLAVQVRDIDRIEIDQDEFPDSGTRERDSDIRAEPAEPANSDRRRLQFCSSNAPLLLLEGGKDLFARWNRTE